MIKNWWKVFHILQQFCWFRHWLLTFCSLKLRLWLHFLLFRMLYPKLSLMGQIRMGRFSIRKGLEDVIRFLMGWHQQRWWSIRWYLCSKFWWLHWHLFWFVSKKRIERLNRLIQNLIIQLPMVELFQKYPKLKNHVPSWYCWLF